jgi:ABC-type antimicrobial peptide transport system permease subunit
MVLGESILLGAAGGAIGCLAGAGLVELVGQSIATSYLRGSLTLPLLIQGIITAIVLGGVGGLYPAWWASRLLPVEAMRYEGGATGAKFQVRSAKFEIRSLKFEVLRSLSRRRGRTTLTIIGVSISLAAVAALGGLVEQAITAFNERFSAGGTDLVVRQQDVTDMAFSTIDERVGRQIAALPGVQSISGSITGIQTSQEIPYLIVMGYVPQAPLMQRFRIIEGRGLSGNRELIIGRLAADALKVRVGSAVRLGDAAFRVVGLFETGMSWEESIAVIALRDAQALYGKPHQVTFYSIKLTDPQQAGRVVGLIDTQFPNLLVARSSEFAESLPDFQSMSGVMLAVSVLAVAVGGIGMVNTMIMSVFERTREIGTLRAVGWRRRNVLIGVLKESLTISLIGAAIGLLMALAFSLLLRQIPMFGSVLAITFSPSVLLRTLIVALCLGAVGGLYPAWRASRLSPVAALRYE